MENYGFKWQEDIQASLDSRAQEITPTHPPMQPGFEFVGLKARLGPLLFHH